MKRAKVESSNIASIGHDGSILEVEFNSGAVYQYENVPIATYVELLQAESVGKYFNKNIKSRYNYRRVDCVLPPT